MSEKPKMRKVFHINSFDNDSSYTTDSINKLVDYIYITVQAKLVSETPLEKLIQLAHFTRCSEFDPDAVEMRRLTLAAGHVYSFFGSTSEIAINNVQEIGEQYTLSAVMNSDEIEVTSVQSKEVGPVDIYHVACSETLTVLSCFFFVDSFTLTRTVKVSPTPRVISQYTYEEPHYRSTVDIELKVKTKIDSSEKASKFEEYYFSSPTNTKSLATLLLHDQLQHTTNANALDKTMLDGTKIEHLSELGLDFIVFVLSNINFKLSLKKEQKDKPFQTAVLNNLILQIDQDYIRQLYEHQTPGTCREVRRKHIVDKVVHWFIKGIFDAHIESVQFPHPGDERFNKLAKLIKLNYDLTNLSKIKNSLNSTNPVGFAEKYLTMVIDNLLLGYDVIDEIMLNAPNLVYRSVVPRKRNKILRNLTSRHREDRTNNRIIYAQQLFRRIEHSILPKPVRSRRENEKIERNLKLLLFDSERDEFNEVQDMFITSLVKSQKVYSKLKRKLTIYLLKAVCDIYRAPSVKFKRVARK